MTNAELIRKVAKRAGVPDEDAKFFFELFLRKASLQLRPGETFKIQGLGFFQLKTGKKRSETEESEISSDFMVFYPIQGDSETLMFNIPADQYSNYNAIDSYFSLSFGKPVIPLKNAETTEYFISSSGIEMRRLAEIKSDKLLREVEILGKYSKGNENLKIEEEQKDVSQMELNWESLSPSSVAGNDDSLIIDENILSWDFTPELDKEIEEESILETKPAEESNDINWDFSIPDENLNAQKEIKDEEVYNDEEVNNNEENNEYQQVRSLSSELNIPGLESSWNSHDDDILKEAISEEVTDQDEKYPFQTDISEYTDEEKNLIQQEEPSVDELYPVDDTFTDNEETTPENVLPESVQGNNLTDREEITTEENIPSDEDIPPDEILLSEENIPEEDIPHVRKKKGLGLFVISAILFIVFAGSFIVIKILLPRMSGTKVTIVPVKQIPPSAVIERSYDIPVTYPYDSNTKLNAFNNPYNIASQQQQNQVSTTGSETQSNQLITGTSEKVKEFIYKNGDKYTVQVSSWPIKKTAEKVAAQFREKGMATEIEKAYYEGEPWYRVRVGYFNSLEEAEAYHKQNR